MHKTPSVSDAIIAALGRTVGMNASELLPALQLQGVSCTKQAVYKELRKLVNAGIVLKYGQRVQLHLRWLLSMVDYYDKLSKRQIEQGLNLSSMLPDGSKSVWRFSNLLMLNDFWTQISLALLKITEAKIHLSWNPHPWFYLLQPRQELEFTRLLRTLNAHSYKIIGNDRFLDKWSEKFFLPDCMTWSYGESPFHKQFQGTYFTVINEYVVEIILSKKAKDEIDSIFSQVKSLTEMEPNVFALFQRRLNVRLKVERNPTKALRYSRAFERYFGVKLQK
jgi:hypothetical protein